MILALLNFSIILGVLLAIVYFLKKHIKKKNEGFVLRSEYITLVDEGITVGLGQRISIIQVGEEYWLFTNGTNGVAFEKINGKIFKDIKKWEEELKKINKQNNKLVDNRV